MMKLIYPICCGLDVHKKVIVATIVTTDKNGISNYKLKTFSTINSDIKKFHDWLIENKCYHVCMESTGKYWIPIFNYLENDIDVCLTHPKYAMIADKKPFNPTDYKELMDPHYNQQRVVLNDTNVFAYLESKGYDTSVLVKRNDN